MTKEKPESEENEKEMAVRKEIRKEWSSLEPKLIEMAHKLEETGTLNHFIIHSKRITYGSSNWKYLRMPGNS